MQGVKAARFVHASIGRDGGTGCVRNRVIEFFERVNVLAVIEVVDAVAQKVPRPAGVERP